MGELNRRKSRKQMLMVVQWLHCSMRHDSRLHSSIIANDDYGCVEYNMLTAAGYKLSYAKFNVS